MGDERREHAESGMHWLIWDGQCGFCQRSIEWVRARDRDGLFRPLPYQEAPSPPMTPELYERARRAVQVIMPDGSVLAAGMAAAFVLEKLGYRRLARFMRWRWIAPVTEWGYRWVARNRGWLGRLVFRSARSGSA